MFRTDSKFTRGARRVVFVALVLATIVYGIQFWVTLNGDNLQWAILAGLGAIQVGNEIEKDGDYRKINNVNYRVRLLEDKATDGTP